MIYSTMGFDTINREKFCEKISHQQRTATSVQIRPSSSIYDIGSQYMQRHQHITELPITGFEAKLYYFVEFEVYWPKKKQSQHEYQLKFIGMKVLVPSKNTNLKFCFPNIDESMMRIDGLMCQFEDNKQHLVQVVIPNSTQYRFYSDVSLGNTFEYFKGAEYLFFMSEIILNSKI